MIFRLIVCMLFFNSLMAQEKAFVWVFLNTNPNRPELPKAEVDSLQAGHMANIGRLAKEGKLLIAGPFFGGGGIFGFRSAVIDSVNEWLSTDPAIKAGRFVLDVYSYKPIVGSMCSVGEKFTMTTYTSIRIIPKTPKGFEGDRSVKELLMSRGKADSLVSAGSFGENGGFVIYRNAIDEAPLGSLSFVKDSTASVAVKRLFIAKGSFCEE